MCLFALAFLVALLNGCGETAATQRARNAIDLADYEKALDTCRAEGRETKSYAVYEACAKEADRKYGLDGGAK